MLALAASLLLAVQPLSDDFTAPRNASIDAAGARAVRIVAKGGTLRVTGRDGAARVEASGTANTKDVPSASLDCTRTLPPWPLAISLTM